jgi:hypothetical protein
MTNIKKTQQQPKHESALMAAVHILVGLTQEGKSINQIAREDFDNNLELVTVWVDYMIGIDWMYKNNDNGKIWIEKIFS